MKDHQGYFWQRQKYPSTKLFQCTRFPNRKKWIRLLAASLAVVVLIPHLTWAFQPSVFITPAKPLGKVYSLNLPKQRGQIMQRANGQKQLVVHIQDLHCHYQIQKNIAWMIDYLVEHHDLKMVGVEGASRPINVTKLSTFPEKSVKRDIAEYFLRIGKLTGAEYYAAVGKQPVRLQGIEDPALYAANHQSVTEFLNDESAGMVWDLTMAVESCKPYIYSKALATFDGLKSAMRQGELSPYRYCRRLMQLAMDKGVATHDYSAVAAYAASKQATFSPDLDLEKLFREMKALDWELREHLYTNQLERQLDAMMQRLDCLENVLSISATTEEIALVRAHPEQYHLDTFLRFLRYQNMAAFIELDPELIRLDDYLEKALDFYQVADQRSTAFVQNLTTEMQHQDVNIAVMITGGYHSEHVLRDLRAQGIGYISIRPYMPQIELVNPYLSLLKNQKTPLEKLLAYNQKMLALRPFFAEHENIHEVLDENTLIPEVRTGYQMMESALKLGYTHFLHQSGAVNIHALRRAYQDGLRHYPANAEAGMLDFKNAQKIMDTYFIPLKGGHYFALLQAVGQPAPMEADMIDQLQMNNVTVRFYDQQVKKNVAQQVRKTLRKMSASKNAQTEFSGHRLFSKLKIIALKLGEQDKLWKTVATISGVGIVAGLGLLQMNFSIAWFSVDATRWLAMTGVGMFLASMTFLKRNKRQLQHEALEKQLEGYSDAMRAEHEKIQERKKNRFMLWPIYGELLSDLKLAIGIVPIIIRMGGTNHSWLWTMGTLGWVLLALAAFTMVSNLIVRLLREKRLWSMHEIFRNLIEEVTGLKNGVVQSVKNFIKNKKNAPHATLLALVLFIAARALDYSTQITSLGTINAVVLFAFAGGFLIMIGVSLLKTKKKTEWLEDVVSQAIRIVCAVVLIEVCKFPFGFFFIVFFGSTSLADRTTYVSLKIFKKVVGVLSFAQFFLHAVDWMQRNKKIAARKRQGYGEALSFFQRLKNSFRKGQPLQQVSFIFMFSSILLVSFYVSLPMPVMVMTQVVTIAALLYQWLVMAKNPKITQKVKITLLASLLPATLIIFSMGLSFALMSINTTWPTLIPTALRVQLLNLEVAIQSAQALFHELVIFVSFMYSLLGFSSVMKDQDKVRQLSEAAPERLAMLQRVVDGNLQQVKKLLKPDDGVDLTRLKTICQAGKMILVPKNGQPGWMKELILSGVFSMDGEIYFRRRLFNLVTDRTAAAMVLREGLIQSGLSVDRIHEIMWDVTGKDPSALALIGADVLAAGNQKEADVILAYELQTGHHKPKVRAAYLRRVLERRYQVDFPIGRNSYVREFNMSWEVINEKMVILLKHGLAPHPYFLRYSKPRIESAAKYLYQRSLMKQPIRLALIKEAFEQTQHDQTVGDKSAIDERLKLEAIEDEEVMDEIIEDYQDGTTGAAIQHQPHTFFQRLWYPVRPLFYKRPAQALETWRLRQPWKLVGNGLYFFWSRVQAPMLRKVRKQDGTLINLKLKHRLLRKYGLEPLSFLMRLSVKRLEQVAIYIHLRKDAGARLTLELYQEAVLATRPLKQSVQEESQRYFKVRKRNVKQDHTQPMRRVSDSAIMDKPSSTDVVIAWQTLHKTIPVTLVNQPFQKNQSKMHMLWRMFFRKILFNQSRSTSGFFIQLMKDGFGIFRMVNFFLRRLIYLWAFFQPRYHGDINTKHPGLLALQRKHGFPDQAGLRLFRRQSGMALQPVHIRNWDEIKTIHHLNLNRFALGGYYEQGYSEEPTLYLPGFLIKVLMRGIAAENGSIKQRWARWRYAAEIALLDLIIESHVPAYRGDEKTFPDQASVQDWEVIHTPSHYQTQATLMRGQNVQVWKQNLRAPVALSFYDILAQAKTVLQEIEQINNVVGNFDLKGIQHELAKQNKQGAPVDVAAMLNILELQPDALGMAIKESGALSAGESNAILRDLIAYYIEYGRTETKSRGSAEPMTEELTTQPHDYFVYAMPKTYQKLHTQLEHAVSQLQAISDINPKGEPLLEQLIQLMYALKATQGAKAGDLIALTPELGRELWQRSIALEKSTASFLSLGKDLGVHKGCAVNGRIEVMEKNGVMVAFRNVLEISSTQTIQPQWQLSAQANQDMLLTPYVGQRHTIDKKGIRNAWLSIPLPLPVLRLFPNKIRRPLLRFAIQHEPNAYIRQILKRDSSHLAKLFHQPESPLSQMYLQYVKNPGPKQAIAFARASVRVVAGIESIDDQAQALHTLDRLVRHIPGWQPVRAGQWDRHIKTNKAAVIHLPGVLWQPGNLGALGAMIDIMRKLPIVIDQNPGKQWRRRYYRFSGQAA